MTPPQQPLGMSDFFALEAGEYLERLDGLEAVARALREGRLTWDAQTRQLAVRSVDDLKIFVRRAAGWTDADTAKADALAQQLEQAGGRPSAQIRAAEAIGLDAGARAFVAREGAAIASALDRAAQT